MPVSTNTLQYKKSVLNSFKYEETINISRRHYKEPKTHYTRLWWWIYFYIPFYRKLSIQIYCKKWVYACHCFLRLCRRDDTQMETTLGAFSYHLLFFFYFLFIYYRSNGPVVKAMCCGITRQRFQFRCSCEWQMLSHKWWCKSMPNRNVFDTIA